jgi:hypothetical protein
MQYFSSFVIIFISAAQVCTCYSTNWIWISSFNWISHPKDYSKLNIFCTLCLKLKNHLYKMVLIKSFPTISRACPNFPIIYFIDFIEFWMIKLFNIQSLLPCVSTNFDVFTHYEPIRWCVPLHKGLSNDTICIIRGVVVWEIFMWQTNKINKQPQYIDNINVVYTMGPSDDNYEKII